MARLSRIREVKRCTSHLQQRKTQRLETLRTHCHGYNLCYKEKDYLLTFWRIDHFSLSLSLDFHDATLKGLQGTWAMNIALAYKLYSPTY